MFKRIDHVEIVPSDLRRAIEFYTDILGFRIKSRPPVNAGPLKEVVYLTLGDTMLELLDFAGPSPATINPQGVGYRMMALEVPDMGKAVEYLKTKGVQITWGPVALGSSMRAEIKDPDGLSIELRQW